MPTIIHKLLEQDEESWEALHEECLTMYLDGACYAFATALHQGLGWPIVGLMNGEVIRHAAVQSPDGRLHDVRGFISEEQFGSPFGFAPPYTLRAISMDNLRRDEEPEEVRLNAVRRARRTAEILWPELPWQKSFTARVSAFADELEILSKKHGLWIRAAVPGARPLLAVSGYDEGGYELSPTHDGLTFTIDRYFRS